MKTVIFSIQAFMLSFLLFGCQTYQVIEPQPYQESKPTGFCEVVGPKYKFRFEKGYDIISLQPLIRKNRIALYFGDSKGHTAAFLMRTVASVEEGDKKRYSETFSLSTPDKVLKLEGFASGKDSITYRKKKYIAYVSYTRQGWLPLEEANITSAELARDISLMEDSWEAALRLKYVRECLDYHKKEEQVVQKRTRVTDGDIIKTVYCFIDSPECNAIWETAIYQDCDGMHFNPECWDEFSEPPLHEDWYPDDTRDTPGAGADSDNYGQCASNSGNLPRVPDHPFCPEALFSVLGVGSAQGNSTGASHYAIVNAADSCRRQCGGSRVSHWGDSTWCCQQVEEVFSCMAYKYACCSDIELVPIPTHK